MSQRLMLCGPGVLEWEDCARPQLADDEQAIVRPIAVATCDLDVAVLSGRFPLAGPFPFGHEGVAEVLEIGASVTTVSEGDLVVVPFQISCGRCDPCLRGATGNCASHPKLSTYGLGSMGGLEWGGLLADFVLVPHADAMLVPLPADVSAQSAASVSDNISDAWRTVAPQLAGEPGSEVLVVGGDGGPNSIGLYAAGLAVALGASRVVYSDTDDARLRIATELGADVLDGPPPRKAGSFPITVDASGSESGLRCALNSTAFEGICTSASVYLEDPALPLFAMYSRGCTFRTGRAHVRPAIPAVLSLIASGFDPTLVTSAVAPWEEAAAVLSEPPMKLIVIR